MASRFARAAVSGVMVAMASAVAAGCAPPDEPAEARPVAANVAPPRSLPRPAVISFVTPAFAQVPALGSDARPAAPAAPAAPADPAVPAPAAPPAPTPAPPAVIPGPVPEQAPPTVPPDLDLMSTKIEHVMIDLDQLIEASLQLQYALLRLRLRPKQPPPPEPPALPEPELAELPIGL